MKIYVTAGAGTGSTTLAAFDNSLLDAGVNNYNLIKLSSVIPPKSEIKVAKFKPNEDEFGNRLYIVCAEERSDLLGHSIAAGIGWYQWGDGRGMFAEHHDIIDVLDQEKVESNVATKLHSTIKDFCEFRNVEFDEKKLGMKIISKDVTDKPSCVLVVAVYESVPWKM